MAGWFDILRRSLGWPSKPRPKPLYVDEFHVYQIDREFEMCTEKISAIVIEREGEFQVNKLSAVPESRT